VRKKTKTTPKKAGPKKSRARKRDSIRTKVAIKAKVEDSALGRIKNAFDDTVAKIKMFLPRE
jgi:hypothetical protein